MARKCQICTHPNRLEIDRDIVGGRALRAIAEKFPLQYQALWRHSTNCISRQLSQAVERQSIEERHNLLSRIDDMLGKAQAILDRNYKAGKDGLALKAIDSQRNTISLLASISYQLHQAKIAELEAKTLESGGDIKSRMTKVREGLKVLTDRELKLYMKLNRKIDKRDASIKIIPDEAPDRATYGNIIDFDALDEDEDSIRIDAKGTRIKRTRYPANDEIMDDNGSDEAEMDEPTITVGPIPSQPLTYTNRRGETWTKDGSGRRRV